MEHVDLDMVETLEMNANSCASAAVPKPTLFGCPGQAQKEWRKKTVAAQASNMLSSDSYTPLGMDVDLVSGQAQFSAHKHSFCQLLLAFWRTLVCRSHATADHTAALFFEARVMGQWSIHGVGLG